MFELTSPVVDLALVTSPIWVPIVIWQALRQRKRKDLLEEAQEAAWELANVIRSFFLVEPCSRCNESEMKLLEVSPNAHSVHYECLHCQKQNRSAAGSPSATQAIELDSRVKSALATLNAMSSPSKRVELVIQFTTVEAPLPYEQTRREPIPEAVRSEVWRRDGGACVKCSSRENLQFDHIIPVSRGGATSRQNLQLLCRQCNLEKATAI